MVEDLLKEAHKRNPSRDGADISYMCGDFLEANIPGRFDCVISSGAFNRKLIGKYDNYTFIKNCIDKAMEVCVEGIAFDFLSDKVDYRYNHTFQNIFCL